MYNPYGYNPNMNQNMNQNPIIGDIILYDVKKGDNVYRIAQMFNSEVVWIQVMNGLNNDFLIHPDQQLIVPRLYKKMPHDHPRQQYEMYF